MGKGRKWLCILGLAVLLAGAGVLLYPQFTAWGYTRQVESSQEIFFHQTQAQGEDGEEKPASNPLMEQLFQDLREENQALFAQGQRELVDPFSYEQPAVDLAQYGLTDGIIGFVSIDKMGITLPIYLGANEYNMTLGAAHLTQTSYPIGGENTNCVLAAHRGYAKAPMFRNIQRLEVGDLVVVENFRETLTYQVEEIKIVTPDDLSCLEIQEGRELLTLLTCHPYPTNTYRYVVVCGRVS